MTLQTARARHFMHSFEMDEFAQVMKRERPARCRLVSKRRERPASDHARQVRFMFKKVLSREQEDGILEFDFLLGFTPG